MPLLADELLRAPVVEALGELGDEVVAAPLVQLLNASDAPADVIADALAGLLRAVRARLWRRRAHRRPRAARYHGQRHAETAGRRPSRRRRSPAGLARVLGWLEGEAVQRALTRLLGHEAVRAQVVEALVRYGAGVVELLVEQLRAEDLDTRQAAAVALGRIGDRRATPALVAALRDPELAVPVAGALARIGDREAFDGLLGAARSPRSGDPAGGDRGAEFDRPPRHGGAASPSCSAIPIRSCANPRSGSPATSATPECLDQVLQCCRDSE